MRGDNYLLALTTTTDEVTGEIKPLFAFPVQVCKATEDKSVKFEVAAPSGAKREQKWLDPATGELLADEQAVIVRRTKRTKQALGFIYASKADGCLVMCEVKFAHQMRTPDEQVKQPLTVDVAQAQIDQARKVIAGMPAADTVLDTATDTADEKKRELIEAAIAGDEIVKPTSIANTVVEDDLEAALAASLEVVGAA
jgi:non-homologous end joining protein Ku